MYRMPILMSLITNGLTEAINTSNVGRDPTE